MHDLPSQKLIEIVTHRQAVMARTGRDVLSDARLCEALLRDLCGEHKREISVLVAAIEGRVPHDLQTSQANTPLAILLTRLTRRLVDDRALAEDAARWAVESWALALGLKLPQQTEPVMSDKSAPAVVSAAPTSRPPALMVPSAPFVFECTWKVEVLGRPAGSAQAEWKKIGETPDRVTVPAGYEVGVRPHGVGDEALAIWINELQDPAAIQWLDLGKHEINDVGLKLLRAFRNLTHLDIANARQITNDGLAHLGVFPMLTHLQISAYSGARQITDSGVSHLKNLTALTDLDLHNTGITDDGLQHINSLVHLVSLNFGGAPIMGAGLAQLQRLTGLTRLRLSSTATNDAGLESLKALGNLTSLILAWTKITDAGLAHLRTLTSLTNLNLYRTSIADAGLVHLRALTNLTDLNLDNTSITDAGLVHLRGLANLENLDIHYCSKITRQGKAALQRPGLNIRD